MKAVLAFAILSMFAGRLSAAVPAEPGRFLPSSSFYYHLENYSAPMHHLQEFADRVHQKILRSQLPDQKKRELCAVLGTIRLAAAKLGLHDNIASGASSVPIRETLHGISFYRTTRVLVNGNPDAPGLLWHSFTQTPVIRDDFLNTIPDSALLAMELQLNAYQVNSCLAEFLTVLGENSPLTVDPQIARALSGRWKIIILSTGTELSVPDRNGQVRAIAEKLLSGSLAGSLKFPGTNGGLRLHAAKDRLVIRLGFIPAQPGTGVPAESAAMELLRQNLPEKASGFGFVSPAFFQLLLKTAGGFNMDTQFPLTAAALSATNEALVLHSVSSWDPVSEERLLPLAIFGTGSIRELLDAGGKLHDSARLLQAEKECTAKLKTMSSALQKYARSHQGKFPAGNTIETFRELTAAGLIRPGNLICPAATGDTPAPNADSIGYDNCSYVYIGGSDRNTPGDFPLVFDWPLNHKNRFQILTVNGQVRTFEVERLNSCRKLASFLQSRFRYSEKDFQRLRAAADLLDAKFLKGHSK